MFNSTGKKKTDLKSNSRPFVALREDMRWAEHRITKVHGKAMGGRESHDPNCDDHFTDVCTYENLSTYTL